jgi:hypothetical protein
MRPFDLSSINLLLWLHYELGLMQTVTKKYQKYSWWGRTSLVLEVDVTNISEPIV